VEVVLLDCGRSSTQLMRDSLGGDDQPRSPELGSQFNTIGMRKLCTRSLVLDANIRFPVVQGAYCADRTGFAAA
jgi:hypothetical protein